MFMFDLLDVWVVVLVFYASCYLIGALKNLVLTCMLRFISQDKLLSFTNIFPFFLQLLNPTRSQKLTKRRIKTRMKRKNGWESWRNTATFWTSSRSEKEERMKEETGLNIKVLKSIRRKHFKVIHAGRRKTVESQPIH